MSLKYEPASVPQHISVKWGLGFGVWTWVEYLRLTLRLSSSILSASCVPFSSGSAGAKLNTHAFASASRKVDIRLPGKRNSNSHGARPVYLIIKMIKWFRTSRLSIKNSLSLNTHGFASANHEIARFRVSSQPKTLALGWSRP